MDTGKILLRLFGLVGQQNMGGWNGDMNVATREPDKICNYCHNRQHFKRDCYAFESRNKQSGAHVIVKPSMCAVPVIERVEISGGELKPQVCIPRAGGVLAIYQGWFCVLTGQ